MIPHGWGCVGIYHTNFGCWQPVCPCLANNTLTAGGACRGLQYHWNRKISHGLLLVVCQTHLGLSTLPRLLSKIFCITPLPPKCNI